MKKVFTLGMMVLCLGLFSLGCEQPAAKPGPVAPPVTNGTTEAAPADEAKPADAAKPADEAKPAEDAKPAG